MSDSGNDQRKFELISRIAVTVAALLPYWPLLTFNVLFVTDDIFTSDIFNGELPGRVLVANLIRHGQLPVWTSRLCSGLPLAGAPADPIGLASFVLLPTARALDLYLVVLLLIAAHGTYSLARRLGVDRPSGVLAGVAFAASGYLVCQLKHLSIVSTVVWLPVGLVLLDRAFDPTPRPAARRSRDLALFGLVVAQQVLSGFPQSAYISALVYAAFGLFRTIQTRRAFGPRVGWLLGGAGVAGVLGSAAGAVVLLPLAALGAISDRASQGYEWATAFPYLLRNVAMFLFPYANGDISNNTYSGNSLFWEDYGYVGFITFLLAVYGAARNRREPATAFLILTTLAAFALVLGGNTPIYHAAYYLLPGLKLFRFPTRFLVVVDLGLAVLAAIGLTRLRVDLSSRRGERPLLCIAIACLAVLDLYLIQPRQNPFVPAAEWLTPPSSVASILGDTAAPRTFTPRHRDLHPHFCARAGGWAAVRPYFQARDLLEPNLGGGFWDTSSADCYAGVTARWYTDVWGDHNRGASLMASLSRLDFEASVLQTEAAFPNVLKAFGVTHVLTPFPVDRPGFAAPAHVGTALIYRVDDTARVRFVSGARVVADGEEALARLQDPAFDPDREILLEGPIVNAAPRNPRSDDSHGQARIVSEGSRDVVVSVEASADGYLLLADTYYPGWSAALDGSPTAIYRANVSVRGVAVPRGSHMVTFRYDPPRVMAGLVVTVVSVLALIAWLAASGYIDWRVAGGRGRSRPGRTRQAPSGT
jgi:hypothetical protein